jgi:non-heme chloroperoxidase
VERIIGQLNHKPARIGRSFGGWLVQILAGRGRSAATVGTSHAPLRGVLPLPFSAIRSSRPVLSNPAIRHRALPLTFDEFRYGFANAVSEDEARALYSAYAVPGAGVPIVQAATANFNPSTEAQVRIAQVRIDDGWQEVADTAPAFIRRFV